MESTVCLTNFGCELFKNAEILLKMFWNRFCNRYLFSTFFYFAYMNKEFRLTLFRNMIPVALKRTVTIFFQLENLRPGVLERIPSEVRDHEKMLINPDPTVRPDADQMSKVSIAVCSILVGG